ncbi:hypothetical protein Taro_040419 [Colocasia esculenta]|uniref:Uncharacterized protein n=1 Tax=Colocasia esculenta TaxID=4460 RepID=A0A843WQC8_COLES|nr:hypothetical protein [Colocasia esculenta]
MDSHMADELVVPLKFLGDSSHFLSLLVLDVTEVVQALVRCRPVSPSHCLALRWFRSRVGRSGVGPQFDRTVVFVVVLGCDSLASLYRGGCRRESAAGVQEGWTVCPSLSYLWRWLGFSCCDSVSRYFRDWVSRRPSLHGGCRLAVSSSVGLVGLAPWPVFSGFRSAGSLGVPGAGTHLLFQ